MHHSKRINTVNHDGEIVPCPYMDLSIGNVTKEPLKDILSRGMMNSWLGPYRDECIIGEHMDFISFSHKSVQDYQKNISPLLPVPYDHGFGLTPEIDNNDNPPKPPEIPKDKNQYLCLKQFN